MLKWKIAFWIAAFFFAINLVNLPFQQDIKFLDFVGLINGGITLIPMYGYANKIAIGNKNIAIGIFLINLPLTIFSMAALTYYMVTDFHPVQIYILAFMIPLIIFLTLPQYFYAFKSENIWRVAV